jgi:cytochrome P450
MFLICISKEIFMTGTCPIPHHVAPNLVRDLDPYNVPGGKEDPFCAWARVQGDSPDVFFTPHLGGYWIINRADLIAQAFSDSDNFSSVGAVVYPAMPAGTPGFPPIQIDPPDHKFFRQPFNLALAPSRLGALGARAREVVIERLEAIESKGECEFMDEMAGHVPVAIVMQLLEMPFEDRFHLMPFVDVMMHSGVLEERMGALQSVAAYAAEFVKKRAQQKGDDFISKLLAVQVGDRPITEQEVTMSVTMLIFGGLDSVSHTMGFIMRFLAENPTHRRQLVEKPELIPAAVEELLRRHSISTLARVLPKDVEIGGVQMKAGDRVILPLALHGLDARAWPNPMEVDFARDPKNILSFGKGVHHCVGANLARAELRVLLEEWLVRIPEFSIKPGEKVTTLTGQNQGITHLPLVWSKA